jgi:hypothetical protein
VTIERGGRDDDTDNRGSSRREQTRTDHELHGSPGRAVFMRFKQLAIVTMFVGGAAMRYGGEYDASSAEQALSPDLHDLRRAFRHATAIYHDTDRLEPNGWVQLQATCFEEDAGTTRLGMVFVKPSRIDGIIDPARPEILYYEPQSDGTLRLMAASTSARSRLARRRRRFSTRRSGSRRIRMVTRSTSGLG